MAIREETVKEVIDLIKLAYEKYGALTDEEKPEVAKFLDSLEKEDK